MRRPAPRENLGSSRGEALVANGREAVLAIPGGLRPDRLPARRDDHSVTTRFPSCFRHPIPTACGLLLAHQTNHGWSQGEALMDTIAAQQPLRPTKEGRFRSDAAPPALPLMVTRS